MLRQSFAAEQQITAAYQSTAFGNLPDNRLSMVGNLQSGIEYNVN